MPGVAHDELVSIVEKLREELKNDRHDVHEKQETLNRMHEELKIQLDRQQSRSIYPENGIIMDALEPTMKSFHENIVSRKPISGHRLTPMIQELQKKSDEVLMLETIRQACKQNKLANTPDSIRGTKAHQEYLKLIGHVYKASGDAIDAAGYSEWVPIDTSQDLRDFLTLNMRVAAVFPSFTMPTTPFYWPFAGLAPNPTYVPEVSDYSTSFSAPAAADQIFGTTDAANRATFTARKIRAFQFYTREWSEDSIRAALPWLVRQMPRAIDRGWEGAIINGAITDNMDGVASGASHYRRWFDGLRQYAIVEAGTWTGVNATDLYAYQFQEAMGGTWDKAKFPEFLRRQRARLDKYGVLLPELVYLVSLSCYYNMLNMTGMQTLADLGPQATLLTGQVGAFDSIPVLISEFFLSVEGKDGTTATENGKTQSTYTRQSAANLLVWTPGWMRGRLPGFGAETVRFAHTDNYEIVMFERGDFQPLEPQGTGGATTVNYGYDIPLFN